MTWIDQAKRPIAEVAHLLGYESRNRHYPCPAGCEGGSRLPVYSTGNGWKCARCDARGDAVDMVSYSIGGARWRELDPARKEQVREWFGAPARREYVAPPVRVVEPPDPAALESFWSSCRPFDSETRAFLSGRAISPAAVAHVAKSAPLRMDERPFWKPGKSRKWRLVVRGYRISEGGVHTLSNFHARAIVPLPDDGPPKALWCAGIPSAGTVMWNGVDPANACLVFVAEGMTDFLSACAMPVRSPVCIYGATSGGFSALARARIRGPVVIAPDSGDVIPKGATMGAGDKYEIEIRKALPGAEVKRVNLPPGVDVNDYVMAGGSVRDLIARALAS
jgi:hypothetical protein